MEILRDKYGKPQGVIREIAGGQELHGRAGNAIATYRPAPDYTYDSNGSRIGSGNRLPGVIREKE